jgi:hypothetical protein
MMPFLLFATEALAIQITSTSPLPDGNRCADYTAFLTSSGGQPPSPDKWKIISGTLPSGLTMDSFYGVQSTLIHGTPTTVQTKTFTVQVKDGQGNTASKVFSLTINPPLTLVITNGTTSFSATRGTFFSFNVFYQGGCNPRTFSITQGQLPPGMSMSGNVISGTPTTAGPYPFTVTLQSQDGQTTSKPFTITVS